MLSSIMLVMADSNDKENYSQIADFILYQRWRREKEEDGEEKCQGMAKRRGQMYLVDLNNRSSFARILLVFLLNFHKPK